MTGNVDIMGDITTAPLRLLKTSFMEQCYADFSDPSDRVYFWCVSALIIYKELSGFTGEAWKYYFKLRFKQRIPAQDHY